MKKWKKTSSALLILCMALTASPKAIFAKDIRASFTASTSGSGNTVNVRKVTYDPASRNKLAELDVKFSHPVSWSRTAEVTSVTDDEGTASSAYLRDKDSDDCEVAVENMKEGRSYTIVIDGIRRRGTDSFRKLTLEVKIPSLKRTAKVKVRKVEVDEENDDQDRYQTEIDIKFTSKVTWKRQAKVTSVKDSNGKSYRGILTDRDDDECEVYIKNLKYGKTYTIKISGVKARGASSYETVTVKAKVPKRTQGLRVKETEYDVDYDNHYEDGVSEYSVEFKFNKEVLFKTDSSVIITDSTGKKYSTSSSYVEWDEDECQVYLSGELDYGSAYQYEIKHVKAIGESSYTTLKGTFTAR